MRVQTVGEFLPFLRDLGVRLAVEGDRLACDAPKGVLTPELTAELISRKSELLEFLRHEMQRGSPSLEIERIGNRSELPLSREQRRLWSLDRVEGESNVRNILFALELNGSLDWRTLESSLEAISDRHEVLLRRIVNIDGTPKSVPNFGGAWRLKRTDLRAIGTGCRNEWTQKIAKEEAQRRFDLGAGPLFRATLLEFDDSRHVLLLTLHRIAADERSAALFAQELLQAYGALRNGRALPFPDLALQYADFARWQERQLESEPVRVQLRYWRRQLQAPLPAVELPYDRPRPSHALSRGARRRFTLTNDLAESVRNLARTEQCSAFVALLSAFGVLLHRYTRLEDIVVGSAYSGRRRPEAGNLVGPFGNPVALRTNLAGDPTVSQLIARVRDTSLNAFGHQDIPFDDLVAEMQPDHSQSRSPFFQVMFLLQDIPAPILDLPELSARPLYVDPGTCRCDLTVEAIEKDGGSIDLEFEYSVDLFDDATVDRIACHYRNLLADMAVNPDRRISALALLGTDEVRALLEAGEQTRAAYPRDTCVHELFEKQANAAPSRIAVVCGSEEVTYSELNRRSNQLAHLLRRMGIGPDGLVGICLGRSIDMLVAVLGVLKAGGAYVPMDPSFPRERLEFMARDTALRVLLTDEQSRGLAPAPEAAVVSLDGDRDQIARESEGPLTRVAAPHNLAYVIFTSGSTGLPKGVQIAHLSVVNFLESMRREPGLMGDDCLLSVTTLSFDIAALELFLPLVTGARLVLIPRSLITDGRVLSQLLSESKATVMQATPATWRLLLDSGWDGQKELRILCGGEAISRDLANRLLEKCSVLWNLYGPTETTIWSTLHKVRFGEGPVPIGKPIANTQLWLLDDYRNPVPPGASGELYIGGDGLALGYLNRPELTAERFVPHPFAPAQRLYRTGDLARAFPDGSLQFLGRLDHQVKIRGFRVELGEIENALVGCAGVSDAAVLLREDVPGDQRLVAYVIPRDGAVVSPDALQAELVTTLPDYMVPSAFVVQTAFPLTPNRKIDRRALPLPAIDALPWVTHVQPTSETQKEIARIWTGILNRNGFGIHDDFFDLGGHSLLLVQLQSRLRNKFGREIPMAEIFQKPTIAALAGLLDPPAADGAQLVIQDEPAPSGAARTIHEDTAGRSFVESQLLAIWQQALELHGIGARDNFFERGGNSQLAAKVMAQMEKVFGVLPGASLLETPTVEKMAAKLASMGIERDWRSLIAIQPSGDRPPLFLVPGGIGNPLTSTNFASSLPPTQPVYGLQFVGLDGSRPALERVEDLAAHFVSEIRSFQKKGPYHLAGHCLGGVIAFEMAQQLTAQGQKVAALTMIDTFPPSAYRPQHSEPISLVEHSLAGFLSITRRLSRVLQLSMAEKLAFVRQKLVGAMRFGSRRNIPRDFQSGDVSNRIWAANIHAIKRYRPKPYKGQIVLIACDGGSLEDNDPRLQWIALSGPHSEIHRLDVPNHDCLVEKPWSRILADELKRTLESGCIKDPEMPSGKS